MNEKTPDVSKIHVDYLPSKNPLLRLSVGACRLRLHPSDDDAAWLTGTYYDPTGSVPLRITETADTVRISQEQKWTEMLGWLKGAPEFDLALGRSAPFQLQIDSGASELLLDVGGVPITRFNLRFGAGKLELDFSEPNPAEMSMLEIQTGAGSIELDRAANANFAEMSVEGGAASYELNFGGKLRRDGHVRVSTGVSSVEIAIPAKLAAKVATDTVLGSVSVDDIYARKSGVYWTDAGLAGESPMLHIQVRVALGSLELEAG